MTTILDDAGAAVAERVRSERLARAWSLATLAARSGVSKAAISKIERGETSPTVALLVKLAGAFETTLGGLLAGTGGVGERLVRAADQPRWRDPASGYVRRQVFQRPDHPVEIVEVELPAGRRVGLPAASYARIRQTVWVMAGQLTVDEGGHRLELAAGDCLGFGAPADVTFANETPSGCTYLVVLARV